MEREEEREGETEARNEVEMGVRRCKEEEGWVSQHEEGEGEGGVEERCGRGRGGRGRPCI